MTCGQCCYVLFFNLVSGCSDVAGIWKKSMNGVRTNAHLLNICYTRTLENAIWKKKRKFLGKMAYWHLLMLVWWDHRCFLTFLGFCCLFVVFHWGEEALAQGQREDSWSSGTEGTSEKSSETTAGLLLLLNVSQFHHFSAQFSADFSLP